MQYVGIFQAPPLDAILLSMLQTATLFTLVLLGLKLVGRRVFGEQSPQDLVILVLIAEACDLGLSDERAGYWGTVASVLTILLLGWTCEKVAVLRRLLESHPVVLFENGKLHRKMMQKHYVDCEDLDLAAREHGLSSHKEFARIVLEGDGKITGVPSKTARKSGK